MAATLSSSDAIAILLNSKAASSKSKFAVAMEVVRRDAEAGKPLQQFVLGLTTEDKELSKRCIEASREKITALAKSSSNPLAWYLLSVEENDVELLRKAANGGNVQALNALGTYLMQSVIANKGTLSAEESKKLSSESFQCFRNAAIKRDPNGFINLGTCYLRGIGCRIDMSLAVECFRSAARAGHPEGMDNLSACYELGHGVAKDPKTSLYWRMKARAARGDEAAAKWIEEGR